MSVIVVDASVGVKRFVPKVHAAEARQWRNGPDELHAPAFFFDLEIANMLWKKVRRAQWQQRCQEAFQIFLPLKGS